MEQLEHGIDPVTFTEWTPGDIDVKLHCTVVVPPEGKSSDDRHDPLRPEGIERLRLTFPDSPRILFAVTKPLEEPTVDGTA